MPNKHFCQGPKCHERVTQDRFLKSRGVIRGRYAMWDRDNSNEYSARAKYFCCNTCEYNFMDKHIEEFIRLHPRPDCLETPIKDPTKETHNNGYYNWNNWKIEVDETR